MLSNTVALFSVGTVVLFSDSFISIILSADHIGWVHSFLSFGTVVLLSNAVALFSTGTVVLLSNTVALFSTGTVVLFSDSSSSA